MDTDWKSNSHLSLLLSLNGTIEDINRILDNVTESMTEVGDALVVIVRNFSAASEACGADRTDKKSQQRLE